MSETMQKIKVDQGQEIAFDEAKLAGVLKWASGGFVLLAGIATFFGVKDGALDRLVRASPTETMVVFFLVGLGVVLAVVAPALDAGRKGPFWLLLLAIVPVVWLSLVPGEGIPGLGAPGATDTGASGLWALLSSPLAPVGVLVVVIVLGLYVAADGARIRWTVAVAVLAVVSVSAGLFAAARIVVADTLDIAGAGFTSDLATADGVRTLTVAAAGTDVVAPFRIVVEAIGAGEHVVLAEELLTPDRSDTVDADISVPVSDLGWAELRVVTCANRSAVDSDPGSTACEGAALVARFVLPRRSEVLGATLTADAKGVVGVEVAASDVPVGGHIEATVRSGSSDVTSIRRGAGPDGTVAWAGSLGVRTGTLVVRGRTCTGEDAETCSDERVLATLVVG